MVPKKNVKIRVGFDYKKLNAATIIDPFPMPFFDAVLDGVAGHEVYSFLATIKSRLLRRINIKQPLLLNGEPFSIL